MKFLTDEEAKAAKEQLVKDMGRELVDRNNEGQIVEVKQTPYGPDKTANESLEEEGIRLKEDLRKVYNKIAGTIRFYLDMPEDKINIVTLWIMGTYMHSEFETFPYLFMNAMRGSGKTRLLKLIEKMAKDGQMISSVTQAILFRTTGTLCLDEFEGIGGKDKDDLKELLNTAYKKGGKVMRARKKKTLDGESQVVEAFETYRPVCMANIWGMDEVLGDRCITINLEKSDDASKTKLVENFSSLNFTWEKGVLSSLYLPSVVKSVVSCSVVSPRNIYTAWNYYIKETTHNYTTTLTTLNYTKLHEDSLVNSTPSFDLPEEFIIPTALFEKINSANLDGRNLELYLPLFLIASKVDGEDVLDRTLEYAQQFVKDKRIEEVTESKDVMVYSMVAKQEPNAWREIKELTTIFRFMIGEGENEWINPKWLGRALKRLNLIKDKKRSGQGMSVILDVERAKQKEEMFK